MHEAGKVVFRITNGSAFFVLKTFTPTCKEKKIQMLLLKTKTQKKINPAKVVLGHTHTAGPGSDSVQTPGQINLIWSDLDMILDLFTFDPEKSENPNTIPHFDLV